MADVSICIPYFERMEFLVVAVGSFKKMGYFDKDYPLKVEVSICDDGSTKEPVPKGWDVGIPMKVSYLPKKTKWKNPCLPRNIAVRQTDSPLVIITCAEIRHRNPIIEKMAALVKHKEDTILPLVKAEGNTKFEWHSHPEHRTAKYCFCQMMTREFFEEVGGFSEEYRCGAGYDDNDFEQKLTRANANWKWAMDCMVIHPSTIGVYEMPSGELNKRLYIQKWGKTR